MPGSPSATPRRRRSRSAASPRESRWNAAERHWLGEGGEIEAVDLEGLWIDVDPRHRRRAEHTLVSWPPANRWTGPSPASSTVASPGRSRSCSCVRGSRRARRPSPPSFALAAARCSRSGVRPAALVLGGILVQAASILDGVDGEIARASLRESPFGGFLDSVLDRAADAAVLAALAVAAGLDATTWALLAAALFGLS